MNFYSKIFYVFFVLIVILTGACTVQEGEKRVKIVGVGVNGAIFKTYEIKVILGGLDDGSGAFSSKMEFILKDKSQFDIAKNILDNDGSAILVYHKKIFNFPCKWGTNGYFVDDIK